MRRLKNLKKYIYPDNVRYNPAVVKKKVRLSLIEEGNRLYLLNESDEVLREVKSETFGFTGLVTMESDIAFHYRDVEPNEGVLVYEEIKDDGIYFSDFLIGIYLYIESKKLGSIRITPKSSKRLGVFQQPLIFEDMSSKSSVDVISLDF